MGGVLLLIVLGLIGFLEGYFLQVVPLGWLTGITAVIALYMLWSTRNAELGSLIGVIAVVYGAINIIVAWGTYFLASGAYLVVWQYLGEHIIRSH